MATTMSKKAMTFGTILITLPNASEMLVSRSILASNTVLPLVGELRICSVT